MVGHHLPHCLPTIYQRPRLLGGGSPLGRLNQESGILLGLPPTWLPPNLGGVSLDLIWVAFPHMQWGFDAIGTIQNISEDFKRFWNLLKYARSFRHLLGHSKDTPENFWNSFRSHTFETLFEAISHSPLFHINSIPLFLNSVTYRLIRYGHS